jgi:hypothetical protein
LDVSKKNNNFKRTPLVDTPFEEKMAKLGQSREDVVLDSLAMGCIAPLKVNLGQR